MPGGHDERAALVRWTTRIVACGVFLLLIAGAFVTSTESGLAVPDWPLSYGRLMPPMVGGIFYEHGHRMVAAAVSTLVGVQAAIVTLGTRRRALKRIAWTAFGAILLQAVLGGLTVIFLLPPAVSSAHAGLAEIVFALTASLAFLTSRTNSEGSAGVIGESAFTGASSATRLAAGAIFVQILLGAIVRHTGAGLAIPDFPLSFGRLAPTLGQLGRSGVPMQLAHRLGAVVVTVLVVRAALRLRALRAGSPFLARLGTAWLVLLAAQLTLGAFSIWTKKAVLVTVAHLAVGALCWVTGVLAAVALSGLAGPAASRESAAGEGSPFRPAETPA